MTEETLLMTVWGGYHESENGTVLYRIEFRNESDKAPDSNSTLWPREDRALLALRACVDHFGID